MRQLSSAVLALALYAGTASISQAADKSRETLSRNDGWAAQSPGTSGGAKASTKRVYTVTNRRELIAALNDGVYESAATKPSATAKIILVKGVIDANVDEGNRILTCGDYARDGYSVDAFVDTYQPAKWGNKDPAGAVEAARRKSHAEQEARVRIRVGSNTTLIGVGKEPTLRGAWLDIDGATNIIVRNLNFVDTYDCFPAWEPRDGELGNWNSEYDSISLRRASHIWIDHNVFEDRATGDDGLPSYFGRQYQIHDGQLDITEGSDLVTVSWNRFVNHDKVMLIGSSDSKVSDRGKLRVSLHHNFFARTGQRTPRVRFGQVHVYNNVYQITDERHFQYAWGAGIESQIVAQNNSFLTLSEIDAARFVRAFHGASIAINNTFINGAMVDVFSAYNSKASALLINAADWRPTFVLHLDTPQNAALRVPIEAGLFRGEP